MRNLTLSEGERIEAIEEGAPVLEMDEETFRAFYDRTARTLWAYLSRATGDSHLADDFLQETYYRFLRTPRQYDSDAHRRNYLFRIATNLVQDGWRGRVSLTRVPGEDEPGTLRARGDLVEDSARRTDVTRALKRMKPRERALLWLAYAHGSSHEEIAERLGVKRASIKLLLFRARRRLAGLLRGYAGGRSKGSKVSEVRS